METVNVGSHDGPGLRGQWVRKINARSATSAPATCMATGPSSGRVGTGVVTGTGNDLDRASRDMDDSLRGRGLLATGVTSAPSTGIVTGPSSVRVGTGVVTRVGTGLDWVLDDEDHVEDDPRKRRRVTTGVDRVDVMGSKTTGEDVVTSDLVQAEASASLAEKFFFKKDQ